MLRQGPLRPFFHALLEYVAGAFLIAVPFALDYNSGGAKAVSILLGIGLIVLAAVVEAPLSLVKTVPVIGHFLLDATVVVLSIALPFLIGFSDEGAPTAVFIVFGVFWLLVTIATRYATPRG